MRLCGLPNLQARRPAAWRKFSNAGNASSIRNSKQRSILALVSEKEADLAAVESVDMGLAQIAKQILATDPEAQEGLRRYEQAVVRLEKAKAASEELDRMFAEASRMAVASDQQTEEKQRQQANEYMADAEVEAAKRLLRAAELELEAAQWAQQELAMAATDAPERVESAKAALIAAAAGLAAELPLTVLTSDGSAGPLSSALTLLSAVASCFLFGVTYRYAVRSDSSNRQLRLGVVAAFGMVRASGAADVLQASVEAAGVADGSGPLTLVVIGQAALYALESLLLFGFASVAVEAAFGQGFLKRFGEAPSSIP